MIEIIKSWLIQPEPQPQPQPTKHWLMVRYERLLTLRAIAMEQKNALKVYQANILINHITERLNSLYSKPISIDQLPLGYGGVIN